MIEKRLVQWYASDAGVDLDIAERRKPQDGKISVKLQGQHVGTLLQQLGGIEHYAETKGSPLRSPLDLPVQGFFGQEPLCSLAPQGPPAPPDARGPLLLNSKAPGVGSGPASAAPAELARRSHGLLRSQQLTTFRAVSPAASSPSPSAFTPRAGRGRRRRGRGAPRGLRARA